MKQSVKQKKINIYRQPRVYYVFSTTVKVCNITSNSNNNNIMCHCAPNQISSTVEASDQQTNIQTSQLSHLQYQQVRCDTYQTKPTLSHYCRPRAPVFPTFNTDRQTILIRPVSFAAQCAPNESINQTVTKTFTMSHTMIT